MTFASVSATAVTLLMVGIFLVFFENVNQMAENIEKNSEIRVHIDVTATSENIKELEKQLMSNIEVATTRFISKDEELKNNTKNMGDGSVYELYQQSNPLHDVFSVKLKNPRNANKVVEEIRNYKFVSSINYGQNYINKLFVVTKWIKTMGLSLVGLLTFIAVFLILNTIRMAIFSRRREIGIMRLVGATNSFIRWPFFLEGFWLGLLGAIGPVILINIGYKYVEKNQLLSAGGLTFFELIPSSPFIANISWILVGIGCLMGVIASLLSIRKYIKI